MVIAPASTGSDSRISQAVTKIDQAKSGTLCSVMPGARMFRKVVIMLIAPRIDEAPDRCTAKIARSIDIAGLGGRERRIEHPAHARARLAVAARREDRGDGERGARDDRASSERLFIRGKAMSGAPICSGMK